VAETNRFDRFQQRHGWIGVPLAVLYKFVDDQGSYLSALITYYGFLSLFPLLLIGVTLLGFFLQGNVQLQQQVLSSALVDFPVVGSQIQSDVHAYTGSTLALVVGLVVGLYGGLGIAQAGQNAMNVVWGVPRNSRPNPLKGRLRSLGILGLLGVGVLATTGLSALATGSHALIHNLHLGPGSDAVALVLSVALDVALFLVAFRVLTVRDVGLRDVAVGAVTAGVFWAVLQVLGTYYMAHELKHSREVYGVFAVFIGTMAWIYAEAVIVVLCAELNVVLRHRLWPRSLLTPFTDDVELTVADRRAYGSYAKAQRFKGYERIEVDFTRPSENSPESAEPQDTTPPEAGSG
jgi:membrane protein